MTDSACWQFSAVDSLFFKEAREMDSSGQGEIDSLFPPPVNTLIGATRSMIAEMSFPGMDWAEYAKAGSKHAAASLIGFGIDDLGPLSFKGVWINVNGQRLYPAPLNLLEKTQVNGGVRYSWLTPGTTSHCDLGRAVRLPAIPKNMRGARQLQNCWLHRPEYEALLTGKVPANLHEVIYTTTRKTDSLTNRCLIHTEPRLGIARDNRRATVEPGLLYQTRHLRPDSSLLFELDVTGSVIDILSEQVLTRLGGEGRAAAVSIEQIQPALPALSRPDGATGLVLNLLTPALLRCDATRVLPGLAKKETANQTIWHGQLGETGVTMDLITAITGKPMREGGWDTAKNKPRAVRSLTPAGSCYYVVPKGDLFEAAEALHGRQIGDEQELGRGMIAVGYWNKGEMPS